MKECITHHHACDCREARHEAEIDEYSKSVKRLDTKYTKLEAMAEGVRLANVELHKENKELKDKVISLQREILEGKL